VALPTDWRILDVAKDGRALMSSETVLRQIELWSDDRAQPQDFSLFDQSLGSAISKDGKTVLLSDQGSIAGSIYATYLRRPDQPEAVRLGDGQAVDISPDGLWALSIVYGPPSKLLLLPVGAGKTAELPNTRGMTVQAAAFLDGRRVVLLAGLGQEPLRLYEQDIMSGDRQPTWTPVRRQCSRAGVAA